MIVKNVYTSVACNRTPEAADWGSDGLIYFGACNSIAVFDPEYNNESSKIISTLTGHKARVNTVKFLENEEVNVISGSDDSTCILWNTLDDENPAKYILKGHTSGVTVVDVISYDNSLICATGSADSSIKIWNNDQCIQTISLKNGFCFALKFFVLPKSNLLMLAVTTDEDFIRLYAQKFDEKSFIFEEKERLAGHEDWIRGLDCVTNNGDVLLASSSQDTFIRLWRISPRDENMEMLKKFDDLTIDEDIQIEERIFTVRNKEDKIFNYALSLESVLQGHEAWVYGVNFKISDSNLSLLSSSMDKTLIIWKPDPESGIWIESVRVGEVGGGSLGFYGGKLHPGGLSIMGHGFQGSFHIWHFDIELSNWNPGVIIGGHFADVRDISWESDGNYLMSLSADQTTRIHGFWQEKNTWHEIARPQVHGYDMQALCMLSRYKFASGAEEKIVRIFQAPGNFVENLRSLSVIKDDVQGDEIMKNTPLGASVPSLGLTNKGVYTVEEETKGQKHVKDMYPENYFKPIHLTEPPTEETLMQNTLWPEIQKLYGHGFDIFALASTSDGSLIATSCKANNAEHAQIFLWNTTKWKISQKLASHQLTVTQLRFSQDDRFLLSVSRDRRFSLFEKLDDEFKLVSTTDKKNGIHTRIIWCCDWSHDSKYFVTGSRDGKVAVWTKGEEDTKTSLGYHKNVALVDLPKESVTAVAFDRKFFCGNDYLIAIGLESGVVHLYKFDGKFNHLHVIDKSSSHHLTVKRLIFRPNCCGVHLASCGEDNLVRIYDVHL